MELKKQMLISALLVGALVFGGLGTAAAVNPPNTVTLTANGTYDVKFQSTAIVAVPAGGTETVTETVTETGTVTDTVTETETVTESNTIVNTQTVTETETVIETETATSMTSTVVTQNNVVMNPDTTPDAIGLMFVSSAPFTASYSVTVTVAMHADDTVRTVTLTTTTFNFDGEQAFYVEDHGVMEGVTTVTITSASFGGFTATIPFAETPDPIGGTYFSINPTVHGFYWELEV